MAIKRMTRFTTTLNDRTPSIELRNVGKAVWDPKMGIGAAEVVIVSDGLGLTHAKGTVIRTERRGRKTGFLIVETAGKPVRGRARTLKDALDDFVSHVAQRWSQGSPTDRTETPAAPLFEVVS